jgi:hypothetical protein
MHDAVLKSIHENQSEAATSELTSPPARRIKSRPNRMSPDPLGVAPE